MGIIENWSEAFGRYYPIYFYEPQYKEDDINMREINILALKHWGVLAQGLKAIEEANEYAAALSKYLNGYTSEIRENDDIMLQRLDHVLEEMVDTKITLDQMEYLFCEVFGYQDKYNKYFETKLNQLQNRIK